MYYKIGLLRKVKSHIKSGGVIAYPTESCFGFGCDPHNYKAVNKILKIKKRNKNKGLIVVADKFLRFDKLVQTIGDEDMEYVSKFWPGPYSFILATNPKISPILTGAHNSLAVRVSRHNLIRQLCVYLAIPLVSTSANKSNCISVKTYRECTRQFAGAVLRFHAVALD